MSGLDVSLRLRLNQDLTKEGPKARRELQDLKKAADALGRSGKLQIAGDLQRLRTDRAQREIKELGGAVKRTKVDMAGLRAAADRIERIRTDRAEREIKSLGRAAKRARQDLAKVEHAPGKMAAGTRALGGAMTFLGNSAAGAFAGLLAFASVDTIIRGLNRMRDGAIDLDRALAQVAVTAGQLDESHIEANKQRVATLGKRYGVDAEGVTGAMDVYVAALGDRYDTAVLEPTIKTAKAGGTSPDIVAAAGAGLAQNLKVAPKDFGAAFDVMTMGAAEGQFEFPDMARFFPTLGALYANSGRTGLDAVRELTAFATVARTNTGTSEAAATNLTNILTKIFAPDATKNFKDVGVDLPALKAQTDKSGESYLIAVTDAVLKATGGDQFKISELFGDQQAKLGLSAIVENRKWWAELVAKMETEAPGTVDRNWNFLRDRPKEQQDRRAAVWSEKGRAVGGWWERHIFKPFDYYVMQSLDPDYGHQEDQYARETNLRNMNLGEQHAKIMALEELLAARPKRKEGARLDDGLGKKIRVEIEHLRAEILQAEALQDVPRRTIDDIAPREMWREPIPLKRPAGLSSLGDDLRGELGTDLSGAAIESMTGFNNELAVEGQKAVGIASSIADQIRAQFSFTATPTISPRFAAPSGAPAAAPTAAPGKQSAIAGTGGTKVALHQNIYGGGDAGAVGRRVVREQNRQIRMARAGALHDTGRFA